MHKLARLTLMTAALTFCFSTATLAQAPENNEEVISEIINDEEVYTVWNRIREGFRVPDMQNSVVDKNLKMYLKHPDYLKRMAERSKPFLYHIMEVVDERNLPTELAILPFVESAFITNAKSRVKAAGLWQFMPATGRHYDLSQNLWRDDRYDIIESTNAALNYLEKLYARFGDWQLAFAAYNWGEGNVARAIKRNQRRGLPTDYMSLKMPAETRNYYPKLQAIKNILMNPEKYGLTLPTIYNEPSLIQITKNKDIDVRRAAEFAGMSVDDFKTLNPSFNRPVIVASHNNRMLLPADNLDKFVENLVAYSVTGQPLSSWTTYSFQPGDTIASVAKRAKMSEAELREVNQIPTGRRLKPGSLLLVSKDSGIGNYSENISADTIDATIAVQHEFRTVKYRVRKGDSLSRVARRLGVTQAQIMQANRMKSKTIRVGQVLTVKVPVRTRQYASAQPERSKSGRFYVVRRGDNLQSIAARYDISVASLKKANNLRGSTIRVGQRLVINADGMDVKRTATTQKRDINTRGTYKVKRGDTLFSIASSANMSVNELKRINGLKSNTLRVGQQLRLVK